MKASEIMSSPVFTVNPNTSVRDASALLDEYRITSLPVLDDDGRIVGIVSELDLLRGRIEPDPRRWLARTDTAAVDPPAQVGDVMTKVVICLPDFTDAAELAEAMISSNIRAIPITDGLHLVGIVSRHDLLRTLLRDDDQIRDDVRSRLDTYSGEPDRWKVEVEEGIVNLHGPFEDEQQRHIVTTLARTVPGAVRVHVRPKWFG